MSRAGAWQLKKLVVRYCKHGGSSSGVRNLLASSEWNAWRSQNPWLQVETTVAGARHPMLRAEYAHGAVKTVCVRNAEPSAALSVAQRLRDQLGFKSRPLTEDKRHTSRRPSIQGSWTPDFVPPALSPQAIRNAYAKKHFIKVEGYDHSKHVYASTMVPPKPAPASAAPKAEIPRRGKRGVGGPRRLHRAGKDTKVEAKK